MGVSMDNSEIDKIVEGYVKFEHSTTKTEDEFFWAWDTLNDYIFDKPETAWTIIIKIIAADSSEKMLTDLSSGPLEYFLVHHGKTYIERVEEEAKKNSNFAKLLGGVWKNVIDDEIWKRIQKVCDKSWVVEIDLKET